MLVVLASVSSCLVGLHTHSLTLTLLPHSNNHRIYVSVFIIVKDWCNDVSGVRHTRL